MRCLNKNRIVLLLLFLAEVVCFTTTKNDEFEIIAARLTILKSIHKKHHKSSGTMSA